MDLGSEHRTVSLPSLSCFPLLGADTAAEPKEVCEVCAASSHHIWMPAPSLHLPLCHGLRSVAEGMLWK